MPEPSSENPQIRFPCPLCADQLGREVPITVEFDFDSRFPTVADLSGCAHAALFGKVGALTLEQERRLIDAALMAFEAWCRKQHDR